MTGESGTEPRFVSITGAGGVPLTLARIDVASDTGRVLLFLHGIGSYGALYYHIAEGLADAVDSVYFPDLRGHGRSGGTRGDLGSPSQVLEDIGCMVAAVRDEHPGAAVVLAGESMGGLLALAYSAERPDTLDGLILAAPALGLNTRQLASRESIRRGLATMFDPSAGQIPVTGGVPGQKPRDLRFVEMTTRDPLVQQSVSLKYLATLGVFIFNWPTRYARALRQLTVGTSEAHRESAPEVDKKALAEGLAGREAGPLPVLLLQGGKDMVVDRAASRRLADIVPSTEFVEFPEAWHNLFSDPEAPRVLAVMTEWIHDLPPYHTHSGLSHKDAGR